MKKKIFISVIILFLLMFWGLVLFWKISIEDEKKDNCEVYYNEVSYVENEEVKNITIFTIKEDEATISNNIITESNEMIKQEEKTETKPEAKVEIKTEAKTETKPEAKSETKVETKTDAKSETKAEAKVETKTETKAETKPEAKVETKTEAKTETKPEAKSETKVETKTETKPETKVEAKTETKAEQGDKKLANTTYRKVNTEVVPAVINILNDEIAKDEELKNYGTKAIKGTKEQVSSTSGFTYMFVKDIERGKIPGNYTIFEQRVRNTVGAFGKYYVYAEDEFVYNSTGTESYWCQTLVWIYITF